MIKNVKLLKDFEDRLIRDEQPNLDRSMKLFSAMWGEAVSLKVLPPRDPLEGIEVDIRIAKALNSCFRKPSPG
jgi:hypothetical protein